MERVLTSSQEKVSPMPTDPKRHEKRPPTSSANAVSSHFPFRGRFNEVSAGASKDPAPALTSEGDRDRLLPRLLAVARSNIASYT